MCVRERERERKSVLFSCTCVSEKERERESVCVCVLSLISFVCLQEQNLKDLVNSPDDMDGLSSPMTPSSPSKEHAQL